MEIYYILTYLLRNLVAHQLIVEQLRHYISLLVENGAQNLPQQDTRLQARVVLVYAIESSCCFHHLKQHQGINSSEIRKKFVSMIAYKVSIERN